MRLFYAILFTAFIIYPKAQCIYTIAGGNSIGYNVPATSFSMGNFNASDFQDIALDSKGNLYVPNNFNCVYKIDQNGIITVKAGNGSLTYTGDGGPADRAGLHFPVGAAFDKAGNMYVADMASHVIRKVDTLGIISTVAGSSVQGYSGDGGPALAAKLHAPTGVVVDAKGTIYFSDRGNNCVRKVDTAGIITTIAGNGTAGYSGDGGSALLARLKNPGGVCIDPSGKIYIADHDNGRVRRIDTSGIISTFAGGGTGGDTVLATTAGLAGPTGVAIDKKGNIYISDMWSVRKVDTSGILIRIAGSFTQTGYAGDGGPATQALVNDVGGVAVDSTGNVFLADIINNRIRKIDTLGIITTCMGNNSGSYSGDGGMSVYAQITNPTDIAFDSKGNMYIAEANGNRVRKIDTSGIISLFAGIGPGADAGDGGPATMAIVNHPTGIGVDKSGNVYIAEFYMNVVRKVDTAGIITTIAGVANSGVGYSGDGGPATLARFYAPADVAVDDTGNLYIADSNNEVIRKINTAGIISTFPGYDSIGYPNSLCFDRKGNLFVADGYSITEITPKDSLIYFFSGPPGFSGDGGPQSQAQVNHPASVAVDSIGNIYVVDQNNWRVRKIDTSGIIHTIAGTLNYTSPGGNGIPANQSFLYGPQSVAVDRQGNVYIADNTERIRVIKNGPLSSPHNTTPPAQLKFCKDTVTVLSAAGLSVLYWYADAAGSNYLGSGISLNTGHLSGTTTFYVLDSSACGKSGMSAITVTVTTSPTVTIVSSGTLICSGDSAVLSAQGASTYAWSTGQSADTVSVHPAVSSTYSVVGTDTNGCTSAASLMVNISAGCVWPGDADENLIADNNDLLPVGLKFGKTGAGRNAVSNSWYGYTCTNWNDTLSGGQNTKYADCNGDGSIDFNDTLAIYLNYGQSHPARSMQPTKQTANQDVFLTFNKPFYYPGDTLLAAVNIGSSSNMQTGFYGAAFTVNYDNTSIKPGSEQFYFNNSWVGNIDVQKIKLSKIFVNTGKVDASLVRITHTDTSGFGIVATLRVALKDTLVANELYFTINNAVKTNSNGIYMNLNVGTDSVAIVQSVGISYMEKKSDGILISPNPASDHILIRSSGPIGTIVIYSSVGEKMFEMQSRNNKEYVDISKFPGGLYSIQTDRGNLKLIKQD